MIETVITFSGSTATLQRLIRGLKDKSGLNARVAVDVLALTQTYVAGIPDHKTANRLGAAPTNHLEKVSTQIESDSNKDQATIKIPKASRLAAAFGPYTVVPKKTDGFLTIPASAESYGRRARTFTGLKVMRVNPKTKELDPAGMLALVRPTIEMQPHTPMNVLYLLARKVKIEEDRSLLPFDEMRVQAADSAAGYFTDLAKEGGKIA